MEIVPNFDSKLKITDKDIFDVLEKEKLPPQLKLSLTEIIKDEGFVTFKLETNFIEPSGGNYLGELYVAHIKGNTEKGYKQINLFIKSILQLGKEVDFISFERVYAREIFVYTSVSNIFGELQSKANIPENERFKFAKFYETSNKTAIIMENLVIKGFRVPERMAIPSLSFSEMSIKQLARFHALSFVMKKEHPEYYEKEIVSKKNLLNLSDTFLAFVTTATQHAVEFIEKDEAKERVQKYLREVDWVEKFNFYMNKNTNDVNIGVFCHGDYRAQNILMREEDGVCAEIIPLDFQITYYGHPVNDIIYFIVGTSDQEFRKNHMDNLLSLYHDTLKNYLLHFDMDIEDIYPRKQYDQDFKDRLDYAIIIGLHYLQIFYAPEDDFLDLSMDLTMTKVPVSDLYIRCMNELVDDFIKWGLL